MGFVANLMLFAAVKVFFPQWKNFANRSRIDEVTAMVRVAPFFLNHGVYRRKYGLHNVIATKKRVRYVISTNILLKVTAFEAIALDEYSINIRSWLRKMEIKKKLTRQQCVIFRSLSVTSSHWKCSSLQSLITIKCNVVTDRNELSCAASICSCVNLPVSLFSCHRRIYSAAAWVLL